MLLLGIEHLPKAVRPESDASIDTANHVSVARAHLLDQLNLACNSLSTYGMLAEFINEPLTLSVQTKYGGIIKLLEDCFKYSEHSERIATIISNLMHIESQLQFLFTQYKANVREQHYTSQVAALRKKSLEFLLLLQLVDQYASYIRPGTAASSQAHTQLLAEIRRLQAHFLSLVSSM